MDAIRWHIEQGYSGEEFLFSQDGTWPQKVNARAKVLLAVQKALGLRELGHHKIGRHSVASQAATDGHSIKTIQAQLGHPSSQSTHRYAHLGIVLLFSEPLGSGVGFKERRPRHAATGGHSMKAIQAQLGHRSLKGTEQYAHLGKRAQLRIVADLEPSSPPHGTLTAP
ncbi:MAG: tyrosine-type recombinase/integrase [Deltaproteobacteria bacterium]|nr:tyrosine-type recombinase/integrase [Deltaproteobacteria bacterium]